jgi:hypothetical protein
VDLLLLSFLIKETQLLLWIIWIAMIWMVVKLVLFLPRIVVKLLRK